MSQTHESSNGVTEPRRDTEPDTDALARLVRLAGPAPELDAARLARLKEVTRPHWHRAVAWRRARRAAALGATALAAASLLLFVSSRGVKRAAPADLVAITGAIEIAGSSTRAAGGRIERGQALRTLDARAGLRLRDGTALRLDQRTHVRFLQERELELQEGGIYVDTDPGGRAPLRVHTAFGTVEDVGTRFELRLDGRGLTVRVRDGLVQLRRGEQTFTAHPGEELAVDASPEPRRTTLARNDPSWDWMLEVASAADFDGRELSSFLGWVEHETGLVVRFADPQLEGRKLAVRVSGDISGLPLHQALDVVLPVCGLEGRFEDDALVLDVPGASPADPPGAAPSETGLVP
jgi:ferric-dicitrate binding protein FerR (iron transport regulator)